MATKPPGKEKFKAPLKGTPKHTSPPSPRILYLVMALVAVVILVGGYLFYYIQAQQMRQRVEGGLSIVAQLKVEQIAQWRAERLTDADMLVGSPFFVEGVEKYMASPTDTEIKDKVLARLAVIEKAYPYQDILLTDVNGKVLLSLNDSVPRLSDVTLAQLPVAIKEHKAVMVDFHYPPDSNSPHLDVVAPLFPWGQDSPQAIGAVVFCIDPSQYLYPLVQSSPMPSETAETLLVERDGDQVLFLSELRHQKDTALKLRIPLSQQENPAVMAVMGKEGVIEGRDYRGAEVLAVLKHIPDSPWYMVAKIDTSEALSAGRSRSGFIIASVVGFLAAALAFTGLIWQRRRRLVYQVLYQAEIEAQALRSHFEYLVKYANDIIYLTDENYHIVEVNDRALETYGYTRQEMLGMPLAALIPPGDLSSYQARLRKIQQKGKVVAEGMHQRKDGSTFPVEVSGRTIKIEDKTYLQGIIRDITERKRLEEYLEKERQELRLIIDSSPILVFYKDKEGRFVRVNKAMVESLAKPEEEIVGKTVFDLFSAELAQGMTNDDQEVIKSGRSKLNIIEQYESASGIRWVQTDKIPIFDENGSSVGLVGFAQDITERMDMEESLRLSEQNFRDLIENSPSGIRIANSDGKTLYANRALLDIWGYSSIEELEAVPRKQRYTPESYDEHRERTKKRRQGEFIPTNYEISIVRKDGDVRHLAASRGEVLWDGEKQFQVVYQDITERRKAEETIKRQLSEITSYYDNAPIGLAILDTELRFLRINNTLAEINGIPAAEHIGKTVKDIVPALESQAREVTSEIIKTGKAVTNIEFAGETEAQPGVERTWLEGWHPLKDDDKKIIGFTVMIQEITEHKRAEEALRQSEGKYRILFETMAQGVVYQSADGKIFSANSAAERMLGLTLDQMQGRTSMDPRWKAIHEDGSDFPGETHPAIIALKTGKEVKDAVMGVFNPGDEQYHWINIYATPQFRPGESKPYQVYTTFADITERKRTEETLRQSEGKYRTILAEIADSYFEVDLAGNITFVNDSTCHNLRYSRKELLEMSYRDFTTKEDIEHVYQAFNQVYRTGEPNKGFPWKVIRKDGSIGFADASVSLLRSKGGEIIGFRGVGRDITERKMAEEERMQLELKAQITSRLASVGEMAAGVAHEINNPLTAVTGYAQLLVDREDVPSDIRSDLEAINDSARRVAGIVRTLLAFSRQTKPQRKLADINELIESTLVLRAYHLRVNNIEVVTRLVPDVLETVVDPGQIQQVLLNLIVNAEMEMKLAHGKGKLTITTKKSDNTIKICCQDNGPGIKPEVMDKIFDPFFTTREVGEGTGLGLSLCYGIIAEHKGKIYAESQPGKGATFIIELPIVTEVAPPKPAKPDVKKPKKAAKARILVVDDEQVVRDVVNRVLTGEGHKVDAVDNAVDALKKIESKRYKLILVDIKMPGMNGVELYKRIKKINKSLARRVVFITGDIMGADTEKFLSETKVAHIGKPFNAEQLNREVQRALTGGR